MNEFCLWHDMWRCHVTVVYWLTSGTDWHLFDRHSVVPGRAVSWKLKSMGVRWAASAFPSERVWCAHTNLFVSSQSGQHILYWLQSLQQVVDHAVRGRVAVIQVTGDEHLHWYTARACVVATSDCPVGCNPKIICRAAAYLEHKLELCSTKTW